ncbi:MAG: C39 family peptidase [Deltaproteobacteria bacterium]|nr:C39 family peptidase [Deltaproteobacteria bacterium]
MKSEQTVKYISQHWHKSIRARELSNYSDVFLQHWSERSCGLACASMIIRYFTALRPTIFELFHKAMRHNAYSEKGWIHCKLAVLLQEYGIQAQPAAAARDDILKTLNDGKVYIASVSYMFPVNGPRGGHLVLVTRGIDVQGKKYFTLYDPSKWGEKRRRISVDRFMLSYSGRGIFAWDTL